jgi:hypothetical protein
MFRYWLSRVVLARYQYPTIPDERVYATNMYLMAISVSSHVRHLVKPYASFRK